MADIPGQRPALGFMKRTNTHSRRWLLLLSVAVLGWSSIVPGYAADTQAAVINQEETDKAKEEYAKVNVAPAKEHDGKVLFEGRWVQPNEAARLEELRYRKQRVATPIELAVSLNADQLRALQSRRDLLTGLMAVLRVGDRLVIKAETTRWQLWKRHNKLTSEFKQAVSAFGKSKAIVESWSDDSIKSLNLDVPVGADSLADMAFALHNRRNAYPHADLQAEQLTNQGYTVNRNVSDGEITLLAFGGKGFKSEAGKAEQFGQLTLIQFAPGNTAITLAWSGPPTRLLVVSDKQQPMLPLAQDVSLLKNEKKNVRLSESKSIATVHRFSQGPDYKGWQQQDFTLDGPLGFQMDLSRDEIGPHVTSGDYRRVWIVEFAGTDGSPATQRQTAMTYRVKGDDKNVMSNEFLRR